MIAPQLTRRLTCTLLGALVGWLCLGAGGAAAAGRIASVDLSSYPTVRVTVVTPTDASRVPVLDENGMPVSGLSAANLGRLESVVLAIDRSQSMTGKPLANAVAAGREFLATKPNSYQVDVVTFASQALLLTGFSSSTTDGDAALRGIAIDARYGTTLNDAIVLAAGALKAEGQPGRAIILVTDGQETTSKSTLAQAIQAARRAHVAAYAIAVRDATFTPAPLRRLALETGGRFYVVRPDQPLTGVYQTIAGELRHTWQLSYATAARPGDVLRLRVHVLGGGSLFATAQIPAAKRSHLDGRSSTSIVVYAIPAAVALALLLAWPSLLRTARNIRLQRG